MSKNLCRLCSKNFSNLPRHLRDVHKVDTSSPIYFYLKQKTDPSKSSTNNTEEGRGPAQKETFFKCPISDCSSYFVKRIDKHLKGVHGLVPGSVEYGSAREQTLLPGMSVSLEVCDLILCI